MEEAPDGFPREVVAHLARARRARPARPGRHGEHHLVEVAQRGAAGPVEVRAVRAVAILVDDGAADVVLVAAEHGLAAEIVDAVVGEAPVDVRVAPDRRLHVLDVVQNRLRGDAFVERVALVEVRDVSRAEREAHLRDAVVALAGAARAVDVRAAVVGAAACRGVRRVAGHASAGDVSELAFRVRRCDEERQKESRHRPHASNGGSMLPSPRTTRARRRRLLRRNSFDRFAGRGSVNSLDERLANLDSLKTFGAAP